MANEEIITEIPITMGEMKKELEKINKRDEELNLRASKTIEYLNQFVKIKDKEAEELYKKIDKLKIPRLKEQHIKKIIDIMPKTVDDIKAVLQGYTLTINNENMKKIVDVVNKFL